MKEKISNFFKSIKEFWQNATKKTRIILLSSLAAVLVLSLVTALILNHKEYVLLYSGLSNAETARVSAVIQGMGVDAKLEGNTISVLKQDENRVRMQLATEGMPGTADFGYETFKQGTSITATQFEKNQWQINQLQERLAAMIMTMDEVEQAVVTISTAPGSSFALQSDNEPTSAAVMLVKRPGRELSPKQIKGIVNIVENSVHGLNEEHISIADETGYLSLPGAQDADNDNSKLSLIEQVNNTTRNRVMSVIQPIFGPGKVEVAVHSTLDTNEKTSEKTEYFPLDPANPTNNPLDYSEFTRDKDGTGFGPAAGVPGANDNVGTPEYAAMENEAAGSTYFSGHDINDYLVSSLRDQIVKSGLEITDMTVSVIIDAASLPDGQRDQIIDTVSKASGVVVEKISVQNYAFNTPDVQGLPLVQGQDMQRVLLIAGIAVLALIIIFIMIMVFVSKRNKEKQLALEAAEGGFGIQYDENGVPLIDLMQQQPEFEPITLVETQEQKLKSQIKDLADTDPEIVAQLIKTWLVQN